MVAAHLPQNLRQEVPQMLQCLSRAIKELGWLFPLCHPQGICNVFLQDLRMAALPFHSHRAAPT